METESVFVTAQSGYNGRIMACSHQGRHPSLFLSVSLSGACGVVDKISTDPGEMIV